MDEELFCPMCNHKLQERYEGWVCKNWGCKLYHKLEHGWVLKTKESKWTIARVQANGFYSSDRRMWLQREFALKKKEILIRDDYTCRKCGEHKRGIDFIPPIQVHHIIPCHEEMSMFLDADNLITLCNKCHDEVHAFDKRSFSKRWVKNNGQNNQL